MECRLFNDEDNEMTIASDLLQHTSRRWLTTMRDGGL
jgi:hypothetical protein